MCFGVWIEMNLPYSYEFESTVVGTKMLATSLISNSSPFWRPSIVHWISRKPVWDSLITMPPSVTGDEIDDEVRPWHDVYFTYKLKINQQEFIVDIDGIQVHGSWNTKPALE